MDLVGQFLYFFFQFSHNKQFTVPLYNETYVRFLIKS